MEILKILARGRASDKILRDEGYQRRLSSVVDKFFDKRSAGSRVNTHANNKIKQNQCSLNLANRQLAEELHKPIIKKIKKRKVHSELKDNISGADLVNMQLINKFNKGFRFLLRVIDIFSKYAWVVALKDKTFSRKFKKNIIVNQAKYGLIKELNFTTIFFKNS